MTHMERMLEKMDWRLLADQKAWLARMEQDSDHAAGLLNLLDAFMDAVVDDGMVSESTVFPDLD